MKRLLSLFTIFLLILFSPNIFSASTLETEEDVKVTVTTYYSESNQIHTVLADFKPGDSFRFDKNMVQLTDYEFVFWLVNGEVKSNLELNHEFIVTEDLELVAIFKEFGKHVVLFMDQVGNVLAVDYVNPGEDAQEPKVINYKSLPGYMYANNIWDKPYTNITKDTIVTLVYEIDIVFEIVVEGGKISGTNKTSDAFEYASLVTIEADAAPSGKYFSHWQIGNKIVSNSSKFTFRVVESVNIKAIYSDSERKIDPLIYLSNNLNHISEHKLYYSQFFLPSGYELVEYGLITSPNNEKLTLESSNITVYKGNFYFEDTNEFLFSFSNTLIKSVRAYIITKDTNGNFVITYNQENTPSEDGFTITADFTTNEGRSAAQEAGWGGSGTFSSGYFTLDAAGEYLESPSFVASGPIKLNTNIWVSAENGSQTFVIEAYDEDDNLVETSGNIKLSDTSFGKIKQAYTEYEYELENVNGNISYIRFIYNKELSGINLRFSNFTITHMGETKEISAIGVNLGKTIFKVDEELDLSNTVLMIYYVDGSYLEKALDVSNISNFDTSTAGNKKAVVSYAGLSVEVEYIVEKTDPTFTTPSMRVVEYYAGLKLADIELPEGFSWDGPNTLLEIGEAEYFVTYTPDNLNKYNIVTGIKVKVNVLEELKEELFIYEIYGGGGNTGAPYNSDFVILYNNSNFTINLSNYSLQYGSSTAIKFSSMVKLEGNIKPYNYYVIKLASGSNGVDLPINSHITGTINANSSAGKVALVNETNTVNVNDERVLDLVEYSGLSNTKSYRLVADFNTYNIVDVNLDYLIENKELVDLEVENLRSSYGLNQALDLNNAYLLLIYETGVSVSVEIYEYMVEGFNTSTVGIFVLTIIYNEIITSFEYTVSDYSSTEDVYVYYIDIGATGGRAGESALIKVGETEILIDAGANDTASTSELLNFLDLVVFDGVIEYVIATHPDSDHIGGMEVVFRDYFIENVVLYSTTSVPTGLRNEFENIVSDEGSTINYINELVSSNRFISLATGIELEFYNTTYLTSSDTNASSIVFTLNAFDTKVLFTGDAERPQELKYAPLVGDIDIFKLGHHGSSNGTSTELLEYIKPEVAIVTNGDYLGNQYNHPTFEAVKRIYEYSNAVPVYAVTGGDGASKPRTHQRNGTITVEIDESGYFITSENYGENPIELSKTDYWLNNNNPYRNYRYYYADATGILDKVTLKQALHDIIDDHVALSYSGVWEALKDTDEDPNNPNNVILLYTGRSQSKNSNGGSVGQWNREHVWAKSHGDFGTSKPAGTDIHHLRPTDVQVNSTRGSLDFDEGGSIVNSNYGAGSSYSYVNKNTSFEPRDEVKGDVARMIFYMAVRYEGDKSGEPNLELNDKVNNGKNPYMGRVSVLLKWHRQDPVDDFERNRNNVIYSYQQNRNPFIDIPHFAFLLFEGN